MLSRVIINAHNRTKLAATANPRQVYFTMKYSEQYEGTPQTQSAHCPSKITHSTQWSFFLFVAFDNFELFLGVPRGAAATRWRRRARASAGSAWGHAGRRGRAGGSPPGPRPARRSAPNLRTHPFTDPALGTARFCRSSVALGRQPKPQKNVQKQTLPQS